MEQLSLPGIPTLTVWDDRTTERRTRKHLEFRLYTEDDGQPIPVLYCHYLDKGKMTLTSYGFESDWTIEQVWDQIHDVVWNVLCNIDPF